MSNPRAAPNLSEIAHRFQLLEFLGEGTAGRTFLAHDAIRSQQVIVKILHDDIVRDAGGFAPLRKTLNVVASLSHPALGRLYDFASWDGVVYLVLEKLSGKTLRDWIGPSAEAIPETLMLSVVRQLAQTLGELGPRLPHGGLKPENIWVGPDHTIRLSDYGINLLASAEKNRSAAALLGTSAYLPPELYQDAEDWPERGDAFALGMIWIEMVRGQGAPAHALRSAEALASLRRWKPWIIPLTEPAPERRRHDLAALGAELEGRAVRSWPDRCHNLWAGLRRARFTTAALMLMAVLLGWLWHRASRPPVSESDPGAWPVELVGSLYDLEAKRLRLFQSGLPHPELAPGFIQAFNAKQELELAMEIGAALNSDSEESRDRLVSAHRAVNARHARADHAQAIAQTLPRIAEALRSLEQLQEDSAPFKPDAIDDWRRRKGAIISRVNSGDFRNAKAAAGDLLDDLTQRIHRESALARQAALSAQATWADALRAHSLPYIEAGQQLQERLARLASSRDLAEVAQAISEFKRIEAAYGRWTQDLEAIPPAGTNMFLNSLGMRFVPLGNLFASIWETRVMDFARYVESSGADMRRLWRERAASAGPTHPVVNISRVDAAAFCRWLTEREQSEGLLPAGQKYRLPTDREWSRLAGLNEPADDRLPVERGWEFADQYPWGALDVPSRLRGNYFTWPNASPENDYFKSMDPFHQTAPVGQFAPNPSGLFDLGGNVWEWVSDGMHSDPGRATRGHFVARGGGWRTIGLDEMQSAHRKQIPTDHPEVGFRVVLSPAQFQDE